MFELKFTQTAKENFDELKANPAKKNILNQVRKTLSYLQANPRHPSLRTHAYNSIPHPWNSNEKVWEAYAQNKTPGAYRTFWCYGPDRKQITIIAITSHP